MLDFEYVTRRHSFRAVRQLAEASYGANPRATMMDEEMWRAFPRGYVGAWNGEGLVGCIQLWPLDGQRAGALLIGARSENDLDVDDLAAACNSGRTIWYFAGLVVAPKWRGRGLGAHLFAEAMVRWHRDLPWRAPIRFAALGASREGMAFIGGFGMSLLRPASETVDGHPLFTRTFASEEDLFEVVRAARDAADRKGRLVSSA